jgi:hypothetical protein
MAFYLFRRLSEEEKRTLVRILPKKDDENINVMLFPLQQMRVALHDLKFSDNLIEYTLTLVKILHVNKVNN